MADDRTISFKELVNVRKDEMRGMLPGFTAEVSNGEKSVWVDSPSWLDKTQLKVRGMDADV